MAKKQPVNPGYDQPAAIAVQERPEDRLSILASGLQNPTAPARDLEQATRYAQRQHENMYRSIPLDPGAVLRVREFSAEGLTLAEGLPSSELCEQSLRTGRELRYVRDPRNGTPILIDAHLFTSIQRAA